MNDVTEDDKCGHAFCRVLNVPADSRSGSNGSAAVAGTTTRTPSTILTDGGMATRGTGSARKGRDCAKPRPESPGSGIVIPSPKSQSHQDDKS
ncbi:hypothetical protein EJB05_44694, partial [Eragrostis curvula]